MHALELNSFEILIDLFEHILLTFPWAFFFFLQILLLDLLHTIIMIHCLDWPVFLLKAAIRLQKEIKEGIFFLSILFDNDLLKKIIVVISLLSFAILDLDTRVDAGDTLLVFWLYQKHIKLSDPFHQVRQIVSFHVPIILDNVLRELIDFIVVSVNLFT